MSHKIIRGNSFKFRNLTYNTTVIPASDGTPLNVQYAGNPENPPVLLANGIGVQWHGLHMAAEYLSEYFFVILWDYRGIGGSIPVIERNFSMKQHAQDAGEIMDFFGYDEYFVFGWSMGVPVVLELASGVSGRISKIALIAGSYEYPFRQILPSVINVQVEKLLDFSIKKPYVARIVHKLSGVNFKALVFLLKTVSFAGFNSDAELFDMCVREVLDVNTDNYAQTLAELIKHSSAGSLEKINIPAFVAAAGRDITTPPGIMEKLSTLITSSEYHFYPDATHFLVIEKGDELYAPLIKFFLK